MDYPELGTIRSLQGRPIILAHIGHETLSHAAEVEVEIGFDGMKLEHLIGRDSGTSPDTARLRAQRRSRFRAGAERGAENIVNWRLDRTPPGAERRGKAQTGKEDSPCRRRGPALALVIGSPTTAASAWSITGNSTARARGCADLPGRGPAIPERVPGSHSLPCSRRHRSRPSDRDTLRGPGSASWGDYFGIADRREG